MKALQKAKRLAIALALTLPVASCGIFSRESVVINDYCVRYETIELEQEEADLLPAEKSLKIDRNDADFVKNCLKEDFDASHNDNHNALPDTHTMYSLVLMALQ